jgi:hypothetical protein
MVDKKRWYPMELSWKTPLIRVENLAQHQATIANHSGDQYTDHHGT